MRLYETKTMRPFPSLHLFPYRQLYLENRWRQRETSNDPWRGVTDQKLHMDSQEWTMVYDGMILKYLCFSDVYFNWTDFNISPLTYNREVMMMMMVLRV